ncbi:transcriptional regulator TetR family [Klebsiella pneumoniae]|nr:transcriptional regulator TetR family [Klebsiella pneumoniae]
MQAAMRLALRGGFAAMTVRQIAREAQVAPGSCTTTSPPSAS